MSVPLVPLHYLTQIQQYLEMIGKDSNAWLAAHELSLQQVVEGTVLLEYPKYERLILSAAEIAQVPEIGLGLGQQLSLNSHGTLGFAIRNCTNLQTVFEVISRYLITRTPLLEIQLSYDQNKVTITLLERHDLTAIRRIFIETVVTSMVYAMHNLVESESLVDTIGFPFDEPQYIDVYCRVFNCKVKFSQSNAFIQLNRNALSFELKDSDKHTLHQALALCEKEKESLPQSSSLSSKIKSMLVAHQDQFLSLEQVARQVNMTPRTLHRHLKKEATSFQAIMDEVKHSLALRYLAAPSSSVKQTAYRLGYSDVANFRRAFKRWEGVSPNDYRVSTLSPEL